MVSTEIIEVGEHLLIEKYIKKGLDMRFGCMALGLDETEGARIVSEYKGRSKGVFGRVVDDKIDMVLSNINEHKIAESSLGDMAKCIGELYKIKRLEAGESTDNISVVSRLLEETGL